MSPVLHLPHPDDLPAPGTEPCPKCGGKVNSEEIEPGQFFCWAPACGHSWTKP